MAKKIIVFVVIVLLLAGAGYYYFGVMKNKPAPSVNFPPPSGQNESTQTDTGNPAVNPPPAPATQPEVTIPVQEYKTYSSAQFGYEIKYPTEWGTAVQQGGAFVDFGPGKPQIGNGTFAVDLACIYAGGVGDAENATTSSTTVVYGANTYTETQTFTLTGAKKELAQQSFSIALPATYAETHSFFDQSDYYTTMCTSASIIVKKDINADILKEILTSFKFTK